MCIDLGRRNIRMSQHLLQAPEIGTIREQMTCKSMAQNMGRDFRRIDSGLDRQFLQELPKTLPRQETLPAPRRIQPFRMFAIHAKPSPDLQVLVQGVLRRLVYRYKPFLVPFAPHDEKPILFTNSGIRQGDQF